MTWVLSPERAVELRNLSSVILRSLKQREMDSALPDVLMNDTRSRVLRREEGEYWDYKERVDVNDPFALARLAKRILGFHNAKGGALIYGVDKDYKVTGLASGLTLDSNKLNQKLRKYIGTTVLVFQDSIELRNGKILWVIFCPGRNGSPIAVQENGPTDERGRPEIKKNEYYLRVGDETKVCSEPAEFERLFSGVEVRGHQAYLYDVDEPYFRLLAHHCDLFVGRMKLLDEVRALLLSRHPIIVLDGVGGVGKSALAIELLRHLYDANEYLFIVSLSAKRKVWIGYTSSRVASFSGITEFLCEIARVLQLPVYSDLEVLKKSVIEFMHGCEGLILVDNIEDVDDPAIFNFLSLEVPAPVKVLVTSRIDRGFGGVYHSVPEMDESEARDLQRHELNRLGYHAKLDEAADEKELLDATGGLPLAIKWGASLAVTSGSLLAAAKKLRSMAPTKKEFLNFCFKTMFDELTPLAKDVATLSPYLVHEWNIPTLSVALGKSGLEIEAAVNELKARGIVLATTGRATDPMRLLPMTIDFLSTKLHENIGLSSQVERRIADALGASHGDGFMLNWPIDKRVDVIIKRILDLHGTKEYRQALQLIKLAQSWGEKNSRSRLEFLEGEVTYLDGQRSGGLALMKSALETADPEILLGDERIFFAQALLSHGTKRDEALVIEVLADVIPRKEDIPTALVRRFCELALEHDKIGVLRMVFEKIKSSPECLELARTVLARSNADPQLPFKIGNSLVTLFREAARAHDRLPDETNNLLNWAQRLDEKFSSAP